MKTAAEMLREAREQVEKVKASRQLQQQKPEQQQIQKQIQKQEQKPILAEIQRNKETAQQVKPKNSKKHTITKLPADFREQTLKIATGKLKDSVAVLYATGCRPAELENGIKIKRINDTTIQVEIAGAKCGETGIGQKRGIEKRVLQIDTELNAGTKHLKELLQGNNELTIQYNKNSIRTRINEIGKKFLTAKRYAETSLSPYCFRHALGCDLKSCDTLSDNDKAKIMGHLSVESLDKYGKRRRGGGGVAPCKSVSASSEPHGSRETLPGFKRAENGAGGLCM